MTHFLTSETNPDGYKLEEILTTIRTDIITRCTKITGDDRGEAKQVLENNIRILQLLSESIHLAENSTTVLDKAFGPSVRAQGGPPRIGEP